MKKRKSDKLFELIKSLTGSEKRYLKIYTSMHGGGSNNKYVLLFNAIEKQSRKLSGGWDEEKIKKLSGIKTTKQLKDLKQYLYQLILKSSRVYNNDASIDIHLKEILLDIEFLYKKNLFGQCELLLQKAKKVASEYEKFSAMLELLVLEHKIIRRNVDLKTSKVDLKKNVKEQKEYLKKLNNDYQYKFLLDEFIEMWSKAGRPREEKGQADFKLLSVSPLLRDINMALSLKAKYTFLVIHQTYYYVLNDFSNAYLISKKRVELIMDPHQKTFDFASDGKISSLSLHASICGVLGKHEEALVHIEKIRTIKHDSVQTKDFGMQTYYEEKQKLLIASCRFKELINLIEEVNNWLTNIRSSSTLEIFKNVFYYSSSYSYFILNQFNKAIFYLSKTIYDKTIKIDNEFLGFRQVVNLIYHFEQGNTNTLEYYLRSTYRFLRKKNKLYQLENEVLKFISQSNKVRSKRDLRAAFISLKNRLEPLVKDPLESRMFREFDFISWLESKIDGKPFHEVLREKVIV